MSPDGSRLGTHLGCIHLTLSSGAANVHEPRYVNAFAAHAGDLAALRWLRMRGCVWDELAPAAAAAGGQLAALKYLHIMGCPFTEITCAAAAASGAWPCLIFAHDNGCPWDYRTTECAIGGAHLDIYRWAVSQGCEVSRATRAVAERLLRARSSFRSQAGK